MKFSYLWLKEYVRIAKTPKELAELLTLRAFEVQNLKKIGDDTVLDIALPPNRVPDAAGHIGMAREIGALTKATVKSQKSQVKENKKYKTKDVISVSIDDREGCKRYSGRVIKGITIQDSPLWLRERLESCGLRAINTIVDATNYVMLETGQPLHVFDFDKLEGGKIIVRRSKQGEKMKTLDGQDVVLTSGDLVIADAKAPIALAGIKGGDRAEVDIKTRNIVLEAATFHGPLIRKTSRRTCIYTDSSYRFEHNLHPDLALFAMERFAALIQSLAGGEVLDGVVDMYPKKEKTREVLVDPERVTSLAGVSIAPKIIENIFKRIGASYKKKSKGFFVKPPQFRRDLNGEADYSEEIVRMYGYEQVPDTFPTAFIPAEKNDEHEWLRFIRKILHGAGFSEIYRYAFIGERDIKLLGQHTEDYVELENPVSPNLTYLVREPYENLISYAVSNAERESTIQIFSLDKGFLKAHETGGDGARDFDEEGYLTLLSCNAAKKDGAHQPEGFLEMKGAVSHLLDSMGITDSWFDNVPEYHSRYPRLRVFNHMHPYKRAEIKVGNEVIGVIGELHPSIAYNWKLDRRIYVCEILSQALMSLASSEIEFQEIPKFPAILRDLAILVPQETRIEDVQGIIENAAGGLLEDTDFFDEYMGEGIPDEMRSLAFRLVFRNTKRTLEDREVSESMKKIQAALQERGWEIR